MVDPVRFKRLLIKLIKLLIVLELAGAFLQGVNNKDWSRFGIDLLIAGVLYVFWERVTTTLRDQREELRRKMERSAENIKLWDALLFSLLWSDQIYSDIPLDRRRLVVISYTLIALGLVAAFLDIGNGLMPLVISGSLVLGAVNLITWLASIERGEKETLQTELKLAHVVQVSLMPKEQPALPGFDIAGISLPAKEVGGDLYDYIPLDGGGALGVSVVDVSGKGMQAAMAAVFTSGAFASEARQSHSPAEVLSRLNNTVFEHSSRGHFVSFLYAVLDVPARRLTFANAGQTKPLLCTPAGIRWLDADGVHFPLGMQHDTAYLESTVTLVPGSSLVLLTDGFTEAMNDAKEAYGAERIEAVLRSRCTGQTSAAELIASVKDDISSFVGGAPQHDDMTMVIVRCLG